MDHYGQMPPPAYGGPPPAYGGPPPQGYNQGPPPMHQQSYPPQHGGYPPQNSSYGGPPESLRGMGGPPPENYGGGNSYGGGGRNYDDNKGGQRYPRLYIGKFGKGTQKRDLTSIFERYGKIVDTMFKEDSFAFIEFENIQQAADAMRNLHGTTVNGGRITVEESKPRNNDQKKTQNKTMGNSSRSARLYVGKISGMNTRDLEDLFSRFGKIVDAIVQRDNDYGFVQFAYPEQAQRAVEAMHHSRHNGQRLIVEESKPRNDGLPHGAAPSERRGGGDRGGRDGNRGGNDRDRKGSDSRGGNDRGGRGGGGGGGGQRKDSEFAKIRGLPFNQDITELFDHIKKEVPNASKDKLVLEFDINGKFSGSAYLHLNTSSEISKLRKLEKLNLGKRFIEVIPVDYEDYMYGVDNNVVSDPRVTKEQVDPDEIGMIRLRGIPYKCSPDQIKLLFKGFQITDVKILMMGEKPAGEALVVFSSKSAALHSLHWEGQQIEGRYVEITVSNQKEFNAFKDQNWDVTEIKKIAEQDEKRILKDRNERTGRGQRKQSGDNRRDNDRRGGGNDRGGDRDRSRNNGRDNGGRGGGGDRDNNKCYNCGGQGHKAQECRDREAREREQREQREQRNGSGRGAGGYPPAQQYNGAGQQGGYRGGQGGPPPAHMNEQYPPPMHYQQQQPPHMMPPAMEHGGPMGGPPPPYEQQPYGGYQQQQPPPQYF